MKVPCRFLLAIPAIAVAVSATSYSIAVDAGQKTGPWNRFYEKAVCTDHANLVLHSAYGRNLQGAMKRGHDEMGFQYFRCHGILDDDVGVYSEVSGAATYNWTRFDSIYDAALAAGLRPILEISFMPNALASSSGYTVGWYNGVPGNISPPKDWTKWVALIKALVLHCEQRYGAAEVRQWYFEIWNEPDGFYYYAESGGFATNYIKLYDYTVEGFRQADSLCKVGGPASAGGSTTADVPVLIQHCNSGTNYATGGKGAKLDFISYHRYSADGGTLSAPGSINSFYKTMVDLLKTNGFSGEVLFDEYGPGTTPNGESVRDNESAASFVAKTVHLLTQNGTAYPPPTALAYWTVSDVYEELNVWANGTNYAYNEDCRGMLLRGDPLYPDSWDLAKPIFHAYSFLHKMGGSQIPCTGGTTGNGVNMVATLSDSSDTVRMIVYNHIDGASANGLSSGFAQLTAQFDTVNLTVNNIPFAPGLVRIEHFVMDRNHSNSYETWVGMGKPKIPTAAQWATLKASAALAHYDSVQTTTLSAKTFTKKFTQNKYSVGFIIITNHLSVPVKDPHHAINLHGLSITRRGNRIIAETSQPLLLTDLRGRMLRQSLPRNGEAAMDLAGLKPGVYLLRCGDSRMRVEPYIHR